MGALIDSECTKTRALRFALQRALKPITGAAHWLRRLFLTLWHSAIQRAKRSVPQYRQQNTGSDRTAQHTGHIGAHGVHQQEVLLIGL